jgi:hypothetical protein
VVVQEDLELLIHQLFLTKENQEDQVEVEQVNLLQLQEQEHQDKEIQVELQQHLQVLVQLVVEEDIQQLVLMQLLLLNNLVQVEQVFLFHQLFQELL